MSNINELNNIVGQVLKQHLQFNKLFSINETFTKILAQHDFSHISSLSEAMSSIMRRHESVFASLGSSFKLNDLTRQFLGSQAAIKELSASYAGVAEHLNAQTAVWAKLTSPTAEILSRTKLSLPNLSNSLLAWECSTAGLTQRLAEIGLLAHRQALASRLLEPSRAYTAFVEQTFERLKSSTAPAIEQALRGSLVLAENQLVGISDLLCTVAITPKDNDECSEPRSLIAPFAQQDQLIAAGEIENEEEFDLLVRQSPAAQTGVLAKNVLFLVTQCNEACKCTAQPEIFKPTTRLLETFADLPWLVSTNKKTFSEFVDCLFFTFYEGAGDDKLRFLVDYGGPLDPKECDFIWCVKHLRNKWVRHDADHGNESKIKKSWEELAETFRALELGHYPFLPEHFAHLHRRLLEQAEVFLALILERLAKSKQ